MFRKSEQSPTARRCPSFPRSSTELFPRLLFIALSHNKFGFRERSCVCVCVCLSVCLSVCIDSHKQAQVLLFRNNHERVPRPAPSAPLASFLAPHCFIFLPPTPTPNTQIHTHTPTHVHTFSCCATPGAGRAACVWAAAAGPLRRWGQSRACAVQRVSGSTTPPAAESTRPHTPGASRTRRTAAQRERESVCVCVCVCVYVCVYVRVRVYVCVLLHFLGGAP